MVGSTAAGGGCGSVSGSVTKPRQAEERGRGGGRKPAGKEGRSPRAGPSKRTKDSGVTPARRTPCRTQSSCARNIPAETRDSKVKLRSQTKHFDIFLGSLPSCP